MNHETVLVIDGGGRGSVLVNKYFQSPNVSRVLAVPGNDLMIENASPGKTVKIFKEFKTTDIKSIIKVCQDYKVDLVDVCQDDAIAAGLVDALTDAAFKVIGPTLLAGQIEWDKAWARDFMKKFKIPIPDYKICKSSSEGIDFITDWQKTATFKSQMNAKRLHTSPAGQEEFSFLPPDVNLKYKTPALELEKFIKKQKEGKWFIKASGLAAGKGAIFANGQKEAINAIGQMKNFGKAGETFLIEQYLDGEEFSSLAIVDGANFQIIGHAQDHKAVYNGDLGPNTGGMGCSSPPMVITPKIEAQIKSVFKKTVEGLVTIGRPYRGILYLGGIIVNGGVKIIEFNARWGDPEAQVIVPAIKNDFYEMALWLLDGKINQLKIKKDNLYRVAVTVASRGYPNDYSQALGKQIFGLGRLLRHSQASQNGAISADSFAVSDISEERHCEDDSLARRPADIESIKVFGAGVKKSGSKYLVSGGRLFYVVGQGKNVAESRKIAYNALSLAYVEGNFIHYRTDIGWRDLERYYQRTHERRT